MATFTNLLPKPLTSSFTTTSSRQIRSASPITSAFSAAIFTRPVTSLINRNQQQHLTTTRATPSGNTTTTTTTTSSDSPPSKSDSADRVKRIHNIDEFDEALRLAKNKLVVVEYATAKSIKTEKIYPFMVELSRTCNDVVFLLVVGDESDRTIAICKREKVQHSPHFTFYKNSVKIHEEEAIEPDELVGDVLYYGDSHSKVIQIHSGEEVEQLISDHKVDGKLIVLDVGLKHCGPCVKVYPTVIKLSRQMEDTVVFARMNGDENESCMKFLKDMDVIQVPTFLFIREGQIVGRYVGSGKGELIGEILRYQGVRVTY